MFSSLCTGTFTVCTGTNTPLQQYVRCIQWWVIVVCVSEGSKPVGMGCSILVACLGDDCQGGALSNSQLDWCCHPEEANLVLVDADLMELVELHVHGFG